MSPKLKEGSKSQMQDQPQLFSEPEIDVLEHETGTTFNELLIRKEKVNQKDIFWLWIQVVAFIYLFSPKHLIKEVRRRTILEAAKKEIGDMYVDLSQKIQQIDLPYISRVKEKREERQEDLQELSNHYPLNAYYLPVEFFYHLNDYTDYSKQVAAIAELFVRTFSTVNPDLNKDVVKTFLESFLELPQLDQDVVKNLLSTNWNALTEYKSSNETFLRFVKHDGEILSLSLTANFKLCVVAERNNRFGVVPLFFDQDELLADRQARKQLLSQNYQKRLQCLATGDEQITGSLFVRENSYKVGFGVPLEKRDLSDEIISHIDLLITTLIQKFKVNKLTKMERTAFNNELEFYLQEGKRKTNGNRKGVWLTCYSRTSQIEMGVRIDASDDIVYLDVLVSDSME